MTSPGQDVLNAALRLSERERANLIHVLLESLDGPADAQAEAAWLHEIARRAQQVENGQAELVDYEAVRAHAVSKLRR